MATAPIRPTASARRARRWASSAVFWGSTESRVFACLLIKIARHGFPRLTFGTADIERRHGEDVLPGAPLHVVRHAIERPFQAGIRIAAASLVSAARLSSAAPP